MIGWHWTSLANWEAIQVGGGMQEYRLGHWELELVADTTEGIFVFPQGPLHELDEMGCVLFQALSKRSWDVVALHVTYSEEDIKTPNCDLKHNGNLVINAGGKHSEWAYHEAKPMEVLTGPITLDRVALHRRYDVRNILLETPALVLS